jgi:RimJ/RimL family protein N-acetyltransferase
VIVTEFLAEGRYHRYGDWLRSQDDDTRHLYFGVASGLGLIESLMDRIEAEPARHKFLVAQNCTDWLGVIHIAEVDDKTVEFGIIVKQELRGEGIGSMLMDEALAWARNRGYQELFMHCLSRNQAVKHLCEKYDLNSCNMFEESEVKMHLEPASFITLNKEISIRQRNLFHRFLQNTTNLYNEIYG